MRLSELNRLQPEEHFDEHDLAIYDEPPQRVIYPSDPDFIATVYFIAERFKDDAAAVDRVMAEYAARFEGRTIYPAMISLKDLACYPYLSSPRAERTLMRQGYVSNLEDRQVPTGNTETRFVSAHKDVVKAEGYVTDRIFAVLNGHGAVFDAAQIPLGEQAQPPRHPLAPITGTDIRLTEDQVADAIPTWREVFEEDEGWTEDDRDSPDYIEQWAAVRKRRKAAVPYALVEVEGLLLGRSLVNADDVIHMAYAASPESLVKEGREVINAGQWINRSSREIAMRLAHELTDQELARTFDARRWPSLREGGDARVTPQMVMVWQSQVLASLRKVAWRVSANSSAAVINNQLRAERLAPIVNGGRPRRPVGAHPRDARPPYATFREVVREDIDRHLEALGTLGNRGAGAANIQATLSYRDLLICSFYGMRYDDLPPDEKPDENYELAFWLGHLRRLGSATMRCGFWSAIEEYIHHDALSELLFSALPEEAWSVLLDAAQELEEPQPGEAYDTGREITVTYDWSEGPEPWSVNREGDTIAITGPLLYFPVNERADWAKKAEFVRENGGFLAPAPR